MGWRMGADVVMVLHLAFIVFVVVGGVFAWRRPRMALVHLPVVLYGVVIEIVGFTCPLTPLEKALRERAGESGYDGGFVEHYVVPIVYPGELTTTIEITLAALIVVVNAFVYGVALRARRPRRDPPATVRGHRDPPAGRPGRRAATAASAEMTSQ